MQSVRKTPVLELESVRKSFSRGFMGRRRVVLSDVSLDIRRGEVFGLLGHNGAGKTTTMRIALGVVRADRGVIRLFGQDGASTEAKARVGFLPDNIGLYSTFNAIDSLRFTGELFRMSRVDVRRRTHELLELVGLADSAKLKIGKYSKGMRQRLGIAQAIMNDPELLVLDEPYSGLDPIGRRDVRNLLLSLKEKGKTIVISSHIVPDVEAVCDRIGVLKAGRIEKCLELQEVYRQKSEEVEITLAGVKGRAVIGREVNVRLVYSTDSAVVLRCEGVEATNAIIRRALESGGRVVELKPLRFNLEDYLFKMLTDDATTPTGDMLRRRPEEYVHQ